jgi:hypothetical protein
MEFSQLDLEDTSRVMSYILSLSEFSQAIAPAADIEIGTGSAADVAGS